MTGEGSLWMIAGLILLGVLIFAGHPLLGLLLLVCFCGIGSTA